MFVGAVRKPTLLLRPLWIIGETHYFIYKAEKSVATKVLLESDHAQTVCANQPTEARTQPTGFST